jgi:hypothetical protein
MSSLVDQPPNDLNARLKTLGGVAALIIVVGTASVQMFKPVVPVMISHRLATFGDGYVISLNNQTNVQISVVMRVTGETHPKPYVVTITIPPNGSREIGWAEGCDLQRGDKVTLEHPRYASETWTVDRDGG